MSGQAGSWSQVAGDYESEFVDPFRPDVKNPLRRQLRRIPETRSKTVADVGCGIGPLLPFLAQQFQAVWAVDFAAGMLERARQACAGHANVSFLERSMTDLAPLHGQLDVAVSVNSLVMPDVRDHDRALCEILACLRPGGRFLGIVPAMDGIHYYTMLALDRALAAGKPMEAARANAAHHAEHEYCDFAFGQFAFRGLEQHFWQPFELRYRLHKTGFKNVRLRKVHLSWSHFGLHHELRQYPASWDWYFQCMRPG